MGCRGGDPDAGVEADGGPIATAVRSAVAASAAADAPVVVDPSDPATLLQASVGSSTTVPARSAAILAAGAVPSGLLLRTARPSATPEAPPVPAR